MDANQGVDTMRAAGNVAVGIGGTGATVALQSETAVNFLGMSSPNELMAFAAGFMTVIYMIVQTYFAIKNGRGK
jgi:hypothetical protein